MLKISIDKNLLNIKMIHSFLTESYWAKGRAIEAVQKSIANSLCFGVYLNGIQIGFARVVTDYTIYAYLMDVFILSKYRGKGYSKQLMETVLEESELKTCSLWMLKTLDAHSLYEQFGFSELKNSEMLMERIIK